MVEYIIHTDDGAWRVVIFLDGYWELRFKSLEGASETLYSGQFDGFDCNIKYNSLKKLDLPCDQLKLVASISQFLCDKSNTQN